MSRRIVESTATISTRSSGLNDCAAAAAGGCAAGACAAERSGLQRRRHATTACPGNLIATSPPGPAERVALDELPAAGPAEPLPLVDDDLAAREDRLSVPPDLHPLEHRVIDAHMVRLRRDDMLGVRIPEDEVCVAPDGDRPLAGVHAEDLGGGGGGDLHPSVERDALLVDAPLEEELEAVLHAGAAVGDFREVVPPELLLF